MRNWPGTAALSFVLCLLTASTADAQQPGTAGLERVEVVGKKGEVSEWFRAESQSFVVYSDTSEEDVTALLDNLEKLDHLLRIYTLPVRRDEQREPKLTLYFHNRVADLHAIDEGMPADAIGLYSSCACGSQGFAVRLERIPNLRDDQLEKSALNDTLSYAFEAYARHFLLRYTDIRAPASFIEGFAQYFSSVRFSQKQIVVGRVPAAIGGYLRFLGNGHRYSLDWEDVLEHRVANARNYAGDAGVRLEFEAKSWLLTHYMLSSEDNRKRQSRYLALVGNGASPTLAFERAFGMKTADLGQVMWRYGQRGVQTLRIDLPTLPAARVSFRTLPRAAGEFVLADAALRSCPSHQAGEALLEKVAALAARFPDDTLARLTLSRAQIDWGDPQEALPRLNAVLQDDDANFEARYLVGMAHLRLAERSEGEARRARLRAAQTHLQRARELRPESAEAALAAFTVEVAAPDAPDGGVLQGVISAWQTAREVDALARAAALAYAFAGNADEAYRALASLAQNLHDEPMARWAKQWQGRLQVGVTRSDILAEMRRHPALDASFREWTVDKAGVMQKVELSAGLESAQSFISQQQEQQNRAMQPAMDVGNGMKKK